MDGQNGVHGGRGARLQDDLLGGLVGIQEVADVEEGVVLGGAVVALEVVPAKLDELLAVLHQLLRRAPYQQRRQLQQLHLHALPVCACAHKSHIYPAPHSHIKQSRAAQILSEPLIVTDMFMSKSVKHET